MRILLAQPARNQRGSTALMFCAMFLPLFFLLFTLFLDLSSYYRQQQRAQLAVDEAAMHSVRLLPQVERAQTAAERYLSQFGDLGRATQVHVDSDAVTLELSDSIPLTFAQFFLPGIAIPFTAYATARVNPIDVYIAVDVSRLTVPSTPAETDEFLETNVSSTFFDYEFPILHPELHTDTRFLTAQCFNRVLSTIKHTAVGIHEYLAGARLNSVGMGIFPSQYAIGDVRRPGVVLDLIDSGKSEGVFPEYHRLNGDSQWCAAAAQFERVLTREIGFPADLSGIVSHFQPGGERGMLVDSHGDLDPEYAPRLRASEALWSAVAHTDFPQTDVVLHEVRSRLAPVPSTARTGLTNHSDHIGVVLSADVPWVAIGAQFMRLGDSPEVYERMRQALIPYRALAEANPSRRFQLFYVVLLDDLYRDEVTSRKAELERLFKEIAEGVFEGGRVANLTLRTLYVETPEEALRTLTSAIALSGREAVLAR